MTAGPDASGQKPRIPVFERPSSSLTATSARSGVKSQRQRSQSRPFPGPRCGVSAAPFGAQRPFRGHADLERRGRPPPSRAVTGAADVPLRHVHRATGAGDLPAAKRYLPESERRLGQCSKRPTGNGKVTRGPWWGQSRSLRHTFASFGVNGVQNLNVVFNWHNLTCNSERAVLG